MNSPAHKKSLLQAKGMGSYFMILAVGVAETG